jgi:DNA topoisomerase-3
MKTQKTQLIIAEKPSVAKAIAACLTGPRSGSHSEGFIQVGDTTVTWCFGHILELAGPEHYNKDYKKWDVAHLPYHIPAFELLPKEDAKAQLKIIGKLLKQKPDEVVNCGDPDREGQMLVDEVLEYHKWIGKTSRMLLNSTDDESVKKALASLQDNNQFFNLYQSAICRSRADWVVGLNLTVAASKLLSSELVSIGRVHPQPCCAGHAALEPSTSAQPNNQLNHGIGRGVCGQGGRLGKGVFWQIHGLRCALVYSQ